MSVKSIVAVALAVLSVSTGCANAQVGDEGDTGDMGTTGTVSAPVMGMTSFDTPQPFDRPMPVIDLPPFRTPELPKPTFVPPTLDTRDTGGCYLRYVKIWDPARGRAIEVGVTVCG